jgi:hypothetical protein
MNPWLTQNNEKIGGAGVSARRPVGSAHPTPSGGGMRFTFPPYSFLALRTMPFPV